MRRDVRTIAPQIEHILITGGAVRQESVRRKLWQRQLKVSSPKQEPTLHAEDIRLYGAPRSESSSQRRGEQGRKRTRGEDDAWEIEHGDKIQPIAFHKAKLSLLDDSNDDDNNADHVGDHMDASLELKHVPQEMIQRCWERAVHATANTLPYDAKPKAPAKDDDTQKKLVSLKETRKKCKELEIDQLLTSLTCPSCTVPFDTQQDLESHFYGTAKVRGCCWNLIQRRRHALVNKTLQREAETTVRNILALVESHARAREAQGSAALNWMDVLDIANSVVVVPGKNALPTLKRTVRADTPPPKELSRIITSAVMEAVSRRLVDRYADIPR